MDRSDFRPYQQPGIDFIKAHNYCAVWVGMRLGKTIMTLTALQDLYDSLDMHKTLVVAPLRVSMNSWPEDFRDWDHIKMDFTLIRGTPAERRLRLASPSPVHIINRELVSWFVSEIGDNFPYDTIVLDESRSFKNHKLYTPNKALTRFGAIRKVRPQVNRVIELTGTPMPKDDQDLWAQIFLLDGGKRLGKGIGKFREEFMVQGREHYLWYMKSRASQVIRERIKDLVYAVDTVVMDEPLTDDVYIDIPAPARKIYRSIDEHFLAKLPSKEIIVADDDASKVSKLLQIASGSVYFPDKTYEVLHTEKYKALDELIELINGNVIIVYNFVFEKEQILAKYGDAVALDSSPDTVQRWQRGEISKLVMHGASGGHGLNLYAGGNDIIWMGATYDRELFDQTNHRLSHPEKEEPVTIHRILAKGVPAESKALLELIKKGIAQTDLLDYMKRQH